MSMSSKFVAYEKCSKKKQRAIDAAKRGSWGLVKPITKVKASGKLYKRSKAKQDVRSHYETGTSCFLRPHPIVQPVGRRGLANAVHVIASREASSLERS